MKPAPPDWPRLSSALFYDDPRAAIDQLERAFGFTTRILVEGPGGEVEHSELTYGESVIMVAGTHRNGAPDGRVASPAAMLGRNTQSLFLYVDDADAHCAQARAAGVEILREPYDSDHGPEYWTDRNYEAVDREGHRWWFAHRVRTGTG